MTEKGWHRAVLDFWFSELTSDDWFAVRQELDDTIRDRFLGLHDDLSRAIPTEAFLESDPALAATIVFDQFSRNMFRGTAKAFASDRLAIAMAANALANAFEAKLPEERKHFFYMPFMHSEKLADQKRCVALFEALGGDAVKYAVEHRDIIERFGRFPHRNRVLGRQTTDAEQAFLAGHEGFGQ